jgi:peptidoglycan/LPS O-acetylase OafA/YrhL
MFIPFRWLKATVIGMIAASAAAWLVLTVASITSAVMITLPVLCCDALGLGALLALIDDRAARARLATLALRVGGPCWIVAELLNRSGYDHPLLFWLQQQSVLLVFVWVIQRAAVGFRGSVGRVLENRVLVGLGTISYGLYVIHNFAPTILWPLSRTLDLPRWMTRGLPTRIVLLSLITIALAWVSWQVMEQPIQSWKRHFPYWRRKKEITAPNEDIKPRRMAA